MSFYCREKELNKMNARYAQGNFELVVIYGRRRVGKTALINEFCKGKKTIFFSALNSSSKDNLSVLSKEICSLGNVESESFPEYKSFDDAFNAITKIGQNERIVLVIDEYPYLAKSDESISSKLQHLIDHKWTNTKIFLILCGSSMNFMQNQVLGNKSPLYGRRTAQFKIEPLTYKETAVFNPQLSYEENAYVYGITGGVPHYINKLDVRYAVDNALVNNFFDTSSYLFEEPYNLLKQELREPSTYNTIITSIAEGSSRLNDIATKVGIESGLLTKYINTLIELGIVRREVPIEEYKGKKTVYLLEDEFFRFWYRFVPKNMSIIASDRMPENYDVVVKAHMHEYMGLVFEKMCRDYLRYYANNLPISISNIGQWWGTDSTTKKEVQIDIVAPSAENSNTREKEYIIGSCKFKNEKIGIDELETLTSYSKVFNKGDKYYYFIFSLSGFTQGLLDEEKKGTVKLVSLKDMYN